MWVRVNDDDDVRDMMPESDDIILIVVIYYTCCGIMLYVLWIRHVPKMSRYKSTSNYSKLFKV